MHKTKEYRDTIYLANFILCISISIALSLIDILIPINFILPGMKLGLANIILVIMLKHYKFSELLLFQFIRITITTFILGLFSVYLFSLSGGILAFIVMYTLYKVFKNKVTIYTISIAGAMAHNLGQTIFGIFYLNSWELIYYIPILMIYGAVTGLILGYIISKILPYVERKFDVNSKRI